MSRSVALTCLFALSLFASSLHGQEFTVHGVVLDATNGLPIAGAHILVEPGGAATSSSSTGFFKFAAVPEQSQRVRVSAVGYSPFVDALSVGRGSDRRLRFELTPSTIALPNVEVVESSDYVKAEVAGTVTEISARDLVTRQPLGTEEVLLSVPGVYVASDDGISNRVNIGIRGLYPRRSDKVLIMEDGVPIQPALFLAPSAYYNPPTERLDAIEVVKNTTNVTYGAGSLAGAINYITHRPPTESSGVVNLTAGENGYGSLFAAYGGMTASERLGGQLQMLYKRGDGARKNTGFDIYNVTGKLLLRPLQGTSISAKVNLHREDAQATYAALTPYMFDQDPRQNAFGDDWLETRRIAGDINVRHVAGPRVVLVVTSYANQFRRYWWRQTNAVVPASSTITDAPDDAMLRIGLDGNRARLRDFTVLGFNPKAVFDVSTRGVRHTLEAGFRVHSERFANVEIDTDRADARPRSFGIASAGDLSDPNGSKRRNELLTARAGAAYVQSTVGIGGFTLTPGLRIESYRQAKETLYDRSTNSDVRDRVDNVTTELIPGVGGTLRIGEAVLYGGVYRGFIPLASSTTFTSLVDDAGFIVSEDLESERSTNLEAGIRATPGEWGKVSAAVFQNTLQNLVAAGRNASFEPIIDNLGEVQYRGLELSLDARIEEIIRIPFGLRVEGSATLLDSEIQAGIIEEEGSDVTPVNGNEAPYAPEVAVNIAFELAPASRLHITGGLHHVSSQFADFNNTVEETPSGDNGRIPAHTFVDASVRYALPGRPIRLFVAAKNLTNRVYRGSRLHRSSSGIFPGGFRQVNVGLEWRI